MNNVGIAVDCSGVGHNQLLNVLDILYKEYAVQPTAFCVPLGSICSVLTYLTDAPCSDWKWLYQREQIHSFKECPVPISVCGRDFLSNQDIIFGEQFQCCPFKKLLRYHDNLPLLMMKKKLITGRHVLTTTLLRALNQMGCDQVIVLYNNQMIQQHSVRCYYWNLDAPIPSFKDHYHIINFLHFT